MIDKQCILCCTFQREHCCFPYKCSTCLDDTWGYMALIQISMSVVIFVIIGLIIVLFLKICNRYAITRATHFEYQNDPRRCPCSGPCCCSYNLQNRSRPPRYNEIHEAPPLYSSALVIQTSLHDPPPAYSSCAVDTSRTVGLEVFSNGGNEIVPIAHHI